MNIDFIYDDTPISRTGARLSKSLLLTSQARWVNAKRPNKANLVDAQETYFRCGAMEEFPGEHRGRTANRCPRSNLASCRPTGPPIRDDTASSVGGAY